MSSDMIRAALTILALAPLGSGQTTILVPEDQPTIGAAIALAQDGDTVLVSPGTYPEFVDFSGKAISVRSSAGPFVTTIDAGGGPGLSRTAVFFVNGEGRDSLLEGFTVTGGYLGTLCTWCSGAGIRIVGSSPTVKNCIVRDNFALSDAGGILVLNGAPLIQNCIIRDNEVTFDAPGILVESSPAEWTVIVNCVAWRNSSFDIDLLGTIAGGPGARMLVINTISRGNLLSFGFNVPPSGILMASNSESMPSGNGNSTANPLWVNPLGGDFRLQAGSPVRDAGSASIPTEVGLTGSLPHLDLLGGPRIAGSAPDKGVHEFLVGELFCAGDGSDAACPCANPGQALQGCANGTGQGALLTTSGSPSVAAGDLVLHSAKLPPNTSGLFFQGMTPIAGGAGIPFGDGLRCAGGAVVRLESTTASQAGETSTTQDVAALGAATAGQTLYYQHWYRDALTSPCGLLFNTSNGLALTWEP